MSQTYSTKFQSHKDILILSFSFARRFTVGKFPSCHYHLLVMKVCLPRQSRVHMFSTNKNHDQPMPPSRKDGAADGKCISTFTSRTIKVYHIIVKNIFKNLKLLLLLKIQSWRPTFNLRKKVIVCKSEYRIYHSVICNVILTSSSLSYNRL